MDILVALNQETLDLHKDELVADGLVVLGDDLDAGGLPALRVPFKDLAPKPIFQNVAALGVLAATLGLDPEVPKALLAQTFAKKGDEIVARNHAVLDAAYEWQGRQELDFEPLDPAPERGPRMMIGANEAIALGALAAQG